MNQFKVLILFLSFVMSACNSGGEQNLKTHKAGGEKSDSGQAEKPREDALKAEVLLDVMKTSLQVVAKNEKAVVVRAQFSLNNRNAGFRRHTFNLELGKTILIDNRDYDLTPNSQLKVYGYRFENKDTKKEYIAIDYRFILSRESEEGPVVTSESQRLLLFETEVRPVVRNPIMEFNFPVPKDFSLTDWVDKKLKAL